MIFNIVLLPHTTGPRPWWYDYSTNLNWLNFLKRLRLNVGNLSHEVIKNISKEKILTGSSRWSRFDFFLIRMDSDLLGSSGSEPWIWESKTVVRNSGGELWISESKSVVGSSGCKLCIWDSRSVATRKVESSLCCQALATPTNEKKKIKMSHGRGKITKHVFLRMRLAIRTRSAG